MVKRYDKLQKWLFLLLAVIYVLLALYLSVGRYYMPQLPGYAPELERYLHRNTGLHWQFEGLRGEWQKLNPVVRVDELKVSLPVEREFVVDSANAVPVDAVGVGDVADEVNDVVDIVAGEQVFYLKNAELRLDVLATLFSGQPRLTDLRANTISLSLERTDDAGWLPRGVAGGAGGGASITGLINHLRHLAVAAIDLVLIDAGEARQLPPMQMEFMRYGQRRHFEFSQQGNDTGSFLLRAELDNRLFSPGMGASLYLQARELNLDGWLSMLPGGWSAHDWTGELWAKRSGDHDGWELATHIENGKLLREGKPAWQLQDLQLELGARTTSGQGIEVWWEQLDGEWRDQALNIPAASIDVAYANQAVEKLTLEIPELDVGQVVEILLDGDLLPAGPVDILNTLKPSGILSHLHMTAPNGQRMAEFQLSARLQDVSVEPWQNAPGGTGIDGYIQAVASAGFVELDSDAGFSLYFPKVYRLPLAFDSAQGRVDWSVADRVKVSGESIALVYGEEFAGGSFIVDVPNGKGGAMPYMNLSIGVKNGQVETMKRYLPYTLSPTLLQWLDESAIKGTAVDAGFIYNGSLRPRDGANRSVNLYFNLADADLVYDAEWPAASGVDGLVDIENARTTVNVLGGDIAGIDIAGTFVELGGEKVDVIAVSGKVSGGLQAALELLRGSPLRRQFGSLLDDWQGSGSLRQGVLDLEIPLAADYQSGSAIEFSSQVVDGGIDMRDLRLQLTDISGPLEYSSNTGLVSSGLQASLWGDPVEVTLGVLDAPPGSNTADRTRVDVSGMIDVANVAQWLQQPVLTFVQGAVPVEARVEHYRGATSITANSTLQGAEIQLPGELFKHANDSLPMQLDWQLSAPSQPLGLSVSERAKVQLKFDDYRLLSGDAYVGINANDYSLDEEAGSWLNSKSGDKLQAATSANQFYITGHLQYLQLEQWMPLVDRYVEAEVQWTGDADNPAASETDSVEFIVSGVRAAEASAFGEQFTDTILGVRQPSAGWLFSVENAMLKGEILLPSMQLPVAGDDGEQANESRLGIMLDYLRLPAASHESGNQGNLVSQWFSGAEPVDASELLPLRVSIDNTWSGENYLGSLAFDFTPSHSQPDGKPDTVLIHNISAQLPELLIESKNRSGIKWGPDENGEQHTWVNLRGQAGDIAEFVSMLNATRGGSGSPISSANGHIRLVMDWPGAPAGFSRERLSAKMNFKLNEGRFVRAPEAAGILRLIGLVNLDTIVRRMRLDFSDLLSDGLSFEELQGEVRVDDQVVYFDEKPIRVKAPSSSFVLSGRGNLRESSIDAELIATLPVASNLPWIAALVGGLPAAAGAFVASRLFEDEVNRFSSAVYSVSGSLDNPQVEFVSLFEDGSTGAAGNVGNGTSSDSNGSGDSNDSSDTGDSSAGAAATSSDPSQQGVP